MGHWVGIAVVGDKVTIVGATVPATGPIVIEYDVTWTLQTGNRADAYKFMHHQIADYIGSKSVVNVIVKASAVSGSTKLSHLTSAELRGVVICAAASSAANVSVLAKNNISRNFGDRKMDEYLKDDAFWTAEVAGVHLRNGSREAAMLLLASRT